jgi:glycosyltransferase involved in cell wall biosynthesis
MKVLFDHPIPFLLAHGGMQIQIEQTQAALASVGVEAEHLRWWDERQQGDVIHYFGRPTGAYIDLAHQKGKPVVITELLGGLGVRPALFRAVQWSLIRLAQRTLPTDFRARMAWDAYHRADACIALTPWERHLMSVMFSAAPQKVHVVPNGVEEVFFDNAPAARGDWLVCAGTITEVKRVLELAEAAVLAQTPVWFIGRPFDEKLDYAQRFRALVRQHPKTLRYEGPITNRAALASAYRQARGFVMVSRWETLSLAVLEAAASGCPLLLSDQPWARSVFGDHPAYCPVASPQRTAPVLRRFYDAAPSRPAPPRPKSWAEVAQQLRGIYEAVLRNSR